MSKRIAYMRRWRVKHPERVKTSCQKWRAAHSEKVKAYMKKWRAAHRKELNEYNKRWQKAHPEQTRVFQRNWYKAHKKKKAADVKKYTTMHPEQARKRRLGCMSTPQRSRSGLWRKRWRIHQRGTAQLGICSAVQAAPSSPVKD